MTRHLQRIGAVGLILFGGLVAFLPAAATSSATTVAVPADPATKGPLTLCGRNGQQVTAGTLAAAPVAWRTIDVTPAPMGYRTGGTATLYAFQPRPGVLAAEWSGEQLTGSAQFSDASHPMVAATPADESLSTYLGDYPLQTPAHLLQLRVYLGAPNSPAYSLTYDASYLQVSGTRWTQLKPGPDDCTSSGKSISDESLLLPKKDLKAPPTHAPGVTTGSAKPGAAPPTKASASSRPASGVTTPAQRNAAQSGSDASSTSDTGRNIIIVVCLVLLAGLGGGYALRRRS
jgi:hypothetical protein